MGLFDRLTSRREPQEGTPQRTDDELRRALWSLNVSNAPYGIRSGRPEGVDFVAELRVDEPAWRGFFAQSQLQRTQQILLRLDAERREVRAVDKMREITWVNSVPTFMAPNEFQRGIIRKSSTRWTIERGSDGKWTSTPTFRFSTEDLKGPVRSVVLAAGWTWRPIAFRKI